MYIRGMGDYGPSSNDIPYVSESSGGDCGCGGSCGGCGGHAHGVGLFDSMDPTTWGIGEYGTLAVGAYVALSAWGDARSPVVRRGLKRARGAAKTGTAGIGSIVLLGGLAYGAYYLWSKSQTAVPPVGAGDYQAQGYVNPQVLMDPTRTSVIQISRGW
jgi:hypothetical protein